MMKLCGKSICKPIDLIFQGKIKHGKFPTEWKKANVVPVHKKGDKQFLKTIGLFLYFPFVEKFLSV